MNPTSAGMGPAARRVMERHEAAVRRYRRWTIATRAVTVALILAALVPVVAMAFIVNGLGIPTALTFVPTGLLVPWLLWHDDVLRLLGRPGSPNFPGEMLRIAQQDDQRAAHPQPFGSVPPDPRLQPRSW